MKALEELVKELPKDLEAEARDFLEYLLEKARKRKKEGRVGLSWEGVLEEFKGQFTSLELEKKASEWWFEDVSHEVSG